MLFRIEKTGNKRPAKIMKCAESTERKEQRHITHYFKPQSKVDKNRFKKKICSKAEKGGNLGLGKKSITPVAKLSENREDIQESLVLPNEEIPQPLIQSLL